MNIQFGQRTIQVLALEARPSELQPRDIIQFGDALFQVQTIQTQCPQWDKKEDFTMYILKDGDGSQVSVRSLGGKQMIYRPINSLRR